MDDKERRIVAECAMKIAGFGHVAEMRDGAQWDPDLIFTRAKRLANDIIKLAHGVPSPVAGSPSAGQAGGSPQASPRTEGAGSPSSPSVPSCPKCDAPMDANTKWTGLGNYEGHGRTESIRWRCSQRGRYIKDRGWEGCDGARWEDIEADLQRKPRSA